MEFTVLEIEFSLFNSHQMAFRKVLSRLNNTHLMCVYIFNTTQGMHYINF